MTDEPWHVNSNDPRSLREIIIDAIAHNLHVQAYADFVEAEDKDEDEVRSGLPRPGPGEDWKDFAGPTSERAKEAARAAATALEANNLPLDLLYAVATTTCFHHGLGYRTHGCSPSRHTPEHFGSDLGMMLTGTGVSWFDDHTEFDLKLPHIEFHYFSRADIDNGHNYEE